MQHFPKVIKISVGYKVRRLLYIDICDTYKEWGASARVCDNF